MFLKFCCLFWILLSSLCSLLPKRCMARREMWSLWPWPVSSSPQVNGMLPLATQATLLHYREREKNESFELASQIWMWQGVGWHFLCLGSVLLLSSVGVHFSPILNKVCCWKLSHRVHSDPKGHIPYFSVGLGWLNSLFFWSLRLLCVSNTLSCVQLMVSEAAKFNVNASLPLVSPLE